ncbi:MAG: PEGA domain-containing protein [Theionarchaea archaeon]|nr:PEGA domain-containing protein [Theionarchaea archaeon]MBU7020359.1 PEGA domain-containing protein [Theionarchaea archaeon]
MRRIGCRLVVCVLTFVILTSSFQSYFLTHTEASPTNAAQSTTVYIYSNVCGFQVWFDGKHIFTTPSDKDWCWFYCVTPGRHTITLKKSGCADATRVVDVVAGVTNEFTIDMKCGGNGNKDLELDIWVDKGCGSTYEDGERLTVYFRSNEDCYAHVYEIMPDGKTQTLVQGKINGDQTYSRSGTLEGPGKRVFVISAEDEESRCTAYVESKAPETGQIKVYVKDDSGNYVSGASVYLDGSYEGKTSSSGYMHIDDVPEGSHTVKASKTGFGEDSEKVYVESGETETVYLTLEEDKNLSATISIASLRGSYNVGQTVQVKTYVKNTGNVSHEFIVGCTFIDPDGAETDLDCKTVYLSPGKQSAVTFSWQIPKDSPEGEFHLIVSVWEREGEKIRSGRKELVNRLDRDDQYFIVEKTDLTGYSWYEFTFVGDDICIYNSGIMKKDICALTILIKRKENKQWENVAVIRIDIYAPEYFGDNIRIVARELPPGGKERLIIDTEFLDDINDFLDACEMIGEVLKTIILYNLPPQYEEIAKGLMESIEDPFLEISGLISSEAQTTAQNLISATLRGSISAANAFLHDLFPLVTECGTQFYGFLAFLMTSGAAIYLISLA